MALDSYDNLIKEIKDYTHRGDLGTKLSQFVQMCEVSMYANPTQCLKVRSMAVTSTTLTTGQYIGLPDEFESARSIRFVTDNYNQEVRFQAPEQMQKFPSNGRPNFYTIIGNEIQFDRTPDNEYTVELQYFRKAEPLSTSNQTNEILTKYPMIYLYGSLAQAFTYSQDSEQQAVYFKLFIDAITGANKSDKKGRYGPAPTLSIDNGMTP